MLPIDFAAVKVEARDNVCGRLQMHRLECHCTVAIFDGNDFYGRACSSAVFSMVCDHGQ
jgi:hypothetical protein